MRKIILATTSPYRKEAFSMLGIPFETCGSEIEEVFEGRPLSPRELVKELAKRKAEAVAERFEEGFVIGFDSVGWFEDKILEKPKSREEAYERLLIMSEKNFQFYTGVCIIDLEKAENYEFVVSTDAIMRKLRTHEIEGYLDEDKNFGTYALGFDPLGHSSSAFIAEINGSYNNLLRGIPLEMIVSMLNELENK